MKRKHSTPPEPADPRLETLRERWAPEWTVWRSRNSRGELNEWCATHRGPSMTLMAPTADALEKSLEDDPLRSLIYG